MPCHNVLILQRRLPSYRITLFELLREHLAQEGITLTLAVDESTAEEHLRPDAGFLSSLAMRLWQGRVRVN